MSSVPHKTQKPSHQSRSKSGALSLLLLLVLLSQGVACTKTVTVFSTKTTFAPKEKFLVLEPQVFQGKYQKVLRESLLGTITSELGPRGFSYMVAWHKMPELYGQFTPTLYKATKLVFLHRSNSIEAANKGKAYTEALIVNLNLLGSRFSEAMDSLKMDSFKPKYLFVAGLERHGRTFSGNLKLTLYGALIDTVERSVVWGMSFDFSSGDNANLMVTQSIKAARKLLKEFKEWIE